MWKWSLSQGQAFPCRISENGRCHLKSSLISRMPCAMGLLWRVPQSVRKRLYWMLFLCSILKYGRLKNGCSCVTVCWEIKLHLRRCNSQRVVLLCFPTLLHVVHEGLSKELPFHGCRGGSSGHEESVTVKCYGIQKCSQ